MTHIPKAVGPHDPICYHTTQKEHAAPVAEALSPNGLNIRRPQCCRVRGFDTVGCWWLNQPHRKKICNCQIGRLTPHTNVKIIKVLGGVVAPGQKNKRTSSNSHVCTFLPEVFLSCTPHPTHPKNNLIKNKSCNKCFDTLTSWARWPATPL